MFLNIWWRLVRALRKLRGVEFHRAQMHSGYYSQCGQDYIVYQKYFNTLPVGVFVDIGAHDGVQISNSLFFESKLKWSGLCVEPLPNIFRQLTKNRTAICENVAITSSEGPVIFREVSGYSEMLSGIPSFYAKHHADRLGEELIVHGGKVRDIQVNGIPLQLLLDRHQITHIDFLTVDVEGSDLSVLKTIDFKKTRIHVIVVENTHRDLAIERFLKMHGFKLMDMVDEDEIYVHQRVKC